MAAKKKAAKAGAVAAAPYVQRVMSDEELRQAAIDILGVTPPEGTP